MVYQTWSQHIDNTSTYFLQEYFGLTPKAATALLKGDPGLKSFFFPLYDKTVICRLEEEIATLGRALFEVVKASAERQTTRAIRRAKKVFMVETVVVV